MWPFKRRQAEIYVPPARDPSAGAALSVLRTVPGPSPWYLDGVIIGGTASKLRWQGAGDEHPFAGKSLLVDGSGAVHAVADFHCYVQTRGRQMLVWYVEDSEAGSNLRLRLFDVGSLSVISKWSELLTALGPANRFHVASGEVATAVLPTSMSDGQHTVALPAMFGSFGELLILVPSTADGRKQNHFDAMHAGLWILNTTTGDLRIVPQDWFNDGAYDFGYQWITRIARLSESTALVGEGIRLGVFELDPTGRQIAKWLVTDTFYQPERQ